MIPKVDTLIEIVNNWLMSIYGQNNQEEIPANTAKPLGNTISINVFVDASHAGEKMTYLSHTGILIYVNNTPINLFSKIQNTVEPSTSGAELKAAWVAM